VYALEALDSEQARDLVPDSAADSLLVRRFRF
jgi:hypothetical protein